MNKLFNYLFENNSIQIDDNLKEINYDDVKIKVKYSITNGGLTGGEFPENLLNFGT
jgi:hypothetical protein